MYILGSYVVITLSIDYQAPNDSKPVTSTIRTEEFHIFPSKCRPWFILISNYIAPQMHWIKILNFTNIKATFVTSWLYATNSMFTYNLLVALYMKLVPPIAADCASDPHCMMCAAPDVCSQCMPGYNTLDGKPCSGNDHGGSYHWCVGQKTGRTGLLKGA